MSNFLKVFGVICGILTFFFCLCSGVKMATATVESVDIYNSFGGFIIGIAFFIGLLVLLTLFSIGFRKTSRRISDEEILYNQFCQKLSKVGLDRPRYMGAIDFKNSALLEMNTNSHSSYSNENLIRDLEQITSLYYQIRYGGNKDSSDLKTLKHLINKLKIK